MKKPKKPTNLPPAKAWAQSAVEAANELGLSRETLRKYLHEAGSPGKTSAGRYKLEEWRKWIKINHDGLEERQGRHKPEAPVVTRKQQIAEELAEIELRKARRLEAEAEGKMMGTDAVDGLIFEVLANFDFHLSNAERDISLKTAAKFKAPAKDARKIVKGCFDAFRYSFRDHPLSSESKRHINAWLELPDALKRKIIGGKFPAKGK